MTTVKPGWAATKSVRTARTWRRLAGAAAVLLATCGPAWAAVSAVGDPAWPASPGVFTVDPLLNTNAQRGITATRNLRQTFKNAATFDVGQIVIGFDVTSQPQGGMEIRIYEVEDVNAATWTPGSLVKELVLFGTLPGSTQRLGFNLSGSDIFTLPARNTGTQGYGIEFSNIDDTSTTGVFFHTNVAATDLFVDGAFYREGGDTIADPPQDIGVALAAAGPQFAPGDTDGDGVDLDDLTTIATNFRTNGTLAQGDVTGDGFIDLFDFRLWKANYPGANSGGGGLAGFESLLGVPEPSSGLLVLVGLAGGAMWRRRLADASSR